MPIDPDVLCACHGLPMYRQRVGYYCLASRRASVRKYQATEAGKAAKQRATDKANARRVRIGARYVGSFPTAALATAAKAHIRRRVHDFNQEQRCRSVETAGKSAN